MRNAYFGDFLGVCWKFVIDSKSARSSSCFWFLELRCGTIIIFDVFKFVNKVIVPQKYKLRMFYWIRCKVGYDSLFGMSNYYANTNFELSCQISQNTVDIIAVNKCLQNLYVILNVIAETNSTEMPLYVV